MKIGISFCLIGKKTRYDGEHRRDDHLLKTLERYVKWIPVCPEVGCGLPVPREAMKLVGNIKHPRLVTKKTKIDHTERMNKYIKRKLKAFEMEILDGFIFKSRSPSCGIQGVKVFDKAGSYHMGKGLLAGAFIDSFPNVPVEDETGFQTKKISRILLRGQLYLNRIYQLMT